MSLGAFWRRMTGYRQPEGALVIDILGDDLLDLGITILNMSREDRALIGWKADEDFRRVFDALAAHAVARHSSGKVPLDGAMHPVRLSEEDWKGVFAVALAAKNQLPDKWPLRVIGRIAAETAKVYPQPGGPRKPPS